MVLKGVFRNLHTLFYTVETLEFLNNEHEIVSRIARDENLNSLWKAYQKKYEYASEIMYEDTIGKIDHLLTIIQRKK